LAAGLPGNAVRSSKAADRQRTEDRNEEFRFSDHRKTAVRGLPKLGIDESDESDTTNMMRALPLLAALLLAPLAALHAAEPRVFDITAFGAKGVMFAAEDPFIWRGADRYWAVVKDNEGNFTHRGYSLALWESADGFDWKLAQHPLVATPEVRWADGRKQKLNALERPQVLFENGQPIALFCAAAEKPGRDGSFNIQIPLKSEP
jgi:hypothetical protein